MWNCSANHKTYYKCIYAIPPVVTIQSYMFFLVDSEHFKGKRKHPTYFYIVSIYLQSSRQELKWLLSDWLNE